MRPWPQAHKNLGAVMLLVLTGLFFWYLLAIRPKAQAVADLEDQIEDLRDKLENSGWTLNAENLETILAENTRKLKGTRRGDKGYDGLEVRAGQIVDQATRTFQKRIEETYGNTATFIDQSGWLDYQSDFTELETWLRGVDVLISEKTFGISQDTANAEIYQLLLHIWTVREVVGLVIKHDLVFAKDPSNAVPTPEGRAALPSRLRVLPAISYTINPDDKAAYLLEFPVRLTVRGTLPDFLAFLADLQNESSFLPVSRIELSTEHPRIRGERPNSEGVVHVQNIEATVVCSSFFRPGSGAPALRIKTQQAAPRGA